MITRFYFTATYVRVRPIQEPPEMTIPRLLQKFQSVTVPYTTFSNRILQ
jgi:hypothetical protein